MILNSLLGFIVVLKVSIITVHMFAVPLAVYQGLLLYKPHIVFINHECFIIVLKVLIITLHMFAVGLAV